MPTPITAEVARKSNSRPRKCTLTQQQRNKKRQRATPLQLQLLKKVFETTQTPTAEMRAQISQEIDMTERSVQIWFQNKRAKAKNFAKRQEDIDCEGVTFVPNSSVMLNKIHGYHQPTALSISPGFSSRRSTPIDHLLGSSGGNEEIFGAPARIGTPMKLNIPPIVFSCSSVGIGSWVRTSYTGTTSEELVVIYQPAEKSMAYMILTPSRGFKIEIPFKNVDTISLTPDEYDPNNGHIWMKLKGKPHFFTRTPRENASFSDDWTVCEDFTSDQKASRQCMHELTGNHAELQGQLLKLYSFQPTKFAHGLLTPPVSATIQDNKHGILGETPDYYVQEDSMSGSCFGELPRHENGSSNHIMEGGNLASSKNKDNERESSTLTLSYEYQIPSGAEASLFGSGQNDGRNTDLSQEALGNMSFGQLLESPVQSGVDVDDFLTAFDGKVKMGNGNGHQDDYYPMADRIRGNHTPRTHNFESPIRSHSTLEAIGKDLGIQNYYTVEPAIMMMENGAIVDDVEAFQIDDILGATQQSL